MMKFFIMIILLISERFMPKLLNLTIVIIIILKITPFPKFILIIIKLVTISLD